MYTLTYCFYDYYGENEYHFDIDAVEMVKAVVDIMADNGFEGVDKDNLKDFILYYFTEKNLMTLFKDNYDDLKDYFYDKVKDLWR